MTFTTVTFLLFLIVVFGLYWALPGRTGKNVLVLVSSYIFYGWWDPRYCVLMMGSSLLDYFIGIGLDRSERPGVRRGLLMISLVAQLGLLGFFKYYNFFAENLHALLTSLGWQVSPFTLQILLPVGISFYTFQTLSYVILIYQRKMHATTQLIDYLAYVSFFPQLVAGPIMKAHQLLPQFLQDRKFDYAEAVDGCRQMLWGFFKKMVLADNLAFYADKYYASPVAQLGEDGLMVGPDGLTMAFATLCFTWQIYCDFSAYSDIAVGCAKLFGIQLMRNFAYPYFSQSVAEFWRRWHISLSTWFRDYVYIPLGGNRKGTFRNIVNVMITFTVSGLWHGASWNFVIWGALNGLGTLPAVLGLSRQRRGPEDTPGGERDIPDPLTLLRMIGTFLFAYCMWVFFRAVTFADAKYILTSFVYPAPWTWPFADFWEYTIKPDPRLYWTLIWLGLFINVEWLQRRHLHALDLPHWPRPLRWLLYTAIIAVILYHGTHGQATFIYFQF